MSVILHVDCVLKTSEQEMVAQSRKKIIKLLDTRLRGFSSTVEIRVKELIREAIEQSNIYQALMSPWALIRTELGLVNPKADMDKIIDILVKSVIVSPIRIVSGVGILGTLTITAIPSSFTELLNTDFGTYISENNKSVPWLNWLLTRGTAKVTAGYQIEYNVGLPTSRTDNAIMVKDTGGGNNWFVPVDYAGTLDDNFITKALQAYKVNEKLIIFMQNELTRRVI